MITQIHYNFMAHWYNKKRLKSS